jgi:hypothetical protein
VVIFCYRDCYVRVADLFVSLFIVICSNFVLEMQTNDAFSLDSILLLMEDIVKVVRLS